MGNNNALKPTSIALPAVLLLLILASGCALSPSGWMGPKYYLIDIPDCSFTRRQANQELLQLVQPSDGKVVKCAEHVKGILRERFNNARLARTGGGALQVLTAAVSSMLTGINGASALVAATILSGTSSIMPELSNVIEAKDRAEVYSEGLKALEDGEARFLKAVAQKSGGKIDEAKMTTDGAELYDTILAAVHVVEARLAALLPSVEELQKLRAVSESVEVAPAVVSLKPGTSTNVQVTHGGPASTASTDSALASADLQPGFMVVKITAGEKNHGVATITLTNGRGGKGTVRAIVETEPLLLDAYSLTLNMTSAKTGTINVKSGGTIKSVQSNNEGIAKAIAGPKGASVDIQAVGEGSAAITVENESERSATIQVVVSN